MKKRPGGLKREVGAFFRANPHHVGVLHSAEAAKGQCETVAKGFRDHLLSRGYKAGLVSSTGLRSPMGRDAAGMWRKGFSGKNRKFLWHAVTRVGRNVVDLTGAQYGSKRSGIRIMPLKKYRKDWSKVKSGQDSSILGRHGSFRKGWS